MSDTPPTGVLVERISNLGDRVEQVRSEIREDIMQLRQDIAGMSFVDQRVYQIEVGGLREQIVSENAARRRFEKDINAQIEEGAEKRTLSVRLATVSLILAAVLPILTAVVAFELAK